MKSMTASDAKTRFGEVLEIVQREPVAIERHGRISAYIIAREEFEAIQQFKLEQLRAILDKSAEQADRKEYSNATIDDIITRGKKRASERKKQL
jgi:prevent-host-death family protein